MNALRIALCSLVLLIATAPLVAQGTYTQFDIPGSLQTFILGVNSKGDMVGIYQDSVNGFNGFLFSGGLVTNINYPGATSTKPTGINDNLQIVGTTQNPELGFLYDTSTQTFTIINYPNTIQTSPFAINNAGTIAGTVLLNSVDFFGFESSGSVFRPIFPPGTSQVALGGIASGGKIVGTITSSLVNTYFTFFRGQYQQLTIPNTPNAVIRGINATGNAIVGYYVPTSGGIAGFLYQNNSVQTLQFPGGGETTPGGIDAQGDIVGYFADQISYHGFIWTPSADAPKP